VVGIGVITTDGNGDMIATMGEGARIVILGGTAIMGIHIGIGILGIIRGITTATVAFMEPATTTGTEDIIGGGTNDEEARRPKRLGVEAAAYAVSTPEFFKLDASWLNGERLHHGEFAYLFRFLVTEWRMGRPKQLPQSPALSVAQRVLRSWCAP